LGCVEKESGVDYELICSSATYVVCSSFSDFLDADERPANSATGNATETARLDCLDMMKNDIASENRHVLVAC
jgi:hypothetical protein